MTKPKYISRRTALKKVKILYVIAVGIRRDIEAQKYHSAIVSIIFLKREADKLSALLDALIEEKFK